MKSGRLVTAGLGLVAALALAVTGCGGTTSGGGGAPPPKQQDPKAALAQGAAEIAKTSFKVTMTMGSAGKLTGEVDPTKKQGRYTVTQDQDSMTIDSLSVDGVSYMKITAKEALLSTKGRWMRLDAGKGSPLSLGQFDAAKIAKTLDHATTVERVAGSDFKGTLDLTRAAEALGQQEAAVTALGDKAKAVPFEASVDGKSRLVRYKLDMPAIGTDPAQPWEVKYSNFGIPVDVQAPPANKIIGTPGS